MYIAINSVADRVAYAVEETQVEAVRQVVKKLDEDKVPKDERSISVGPISPGAPITEDGLDHIGPNPCLECGQLNANPLEEPAVCDFCEEELNRG